MLLTTSTPPLYPLELRFLAASPPPEIGNGWEKHRVVLHAQNHCRTNWTFRQSASIFPTSWKDQDDRTKFGKVNLNNLDTHIVKTLSLAPPEVRPPDSRRSTISSENVDRPPPHVQNFLDQNCRIHFIRGYHTNKFNMSKFEHSRKYVKTFTVPGKICVTPDSWKYLQLSLQELKDLHDSLTVEDYRSTGANINSLCVRCYPMAGSCDHNYTTCNQIGGLPPETRAARWNTPECCKIDVHRKFERAIGHRFPVIIKGIDVTA